MPKMRNPWHRKWSGSPWPMWWHLQLLELSNCLLHMHCYRCLRPCHLGKEMARFALSQQLTWWSQGGGARIGKPLNTRGRQFLLELFRVYYICRVSMRMCLRWELKYLWGTEKEHREAAEDEGAQGHIPSLHFRTENPNKWWRESVCEASNCKDVT